MANASFDVKLALLRTWKKLMFNTLKLCIMMDFMCLLDTTLPAHHCLMTGLSSFQILICTTKTSNYWSNIKYLIMLISKNLKEKTYLTSWKSLTNLKLKKQALYSSTPQFFWFDDFEEWSVLQMTLNWKILTRKDQFHMTRITAGLQPHFLPQRDL